MGKNRLKTKQFAATKRMINPKEIAKTRKGAEKSGESEKRKNRDALTLKRVETQSAGMFGRYNSTLKPPYNVLVDTNFINFSIKNKIDLVKGMMDCSMRLLVVACGQGHFRCLRQELALNTSVRFT